jgi:uncharacterized CHY-type Zn-finger protein
MSDNGPRLDLIKIEASHCWKCGNMFTKSGKHRRTNHHAIPKYLKPKRNASLPVCDECHIEINQHNLQSLPKFEAMKNIISSLKQFIEKSEKILKRSGME